MTERAPTHHAVLVPEANASGMVAVIRSLGRAGYRVHAGSADADALGLFSRFASAKAVHPEYESPDFVPWLRAYVSDNEIEAIVPSEGFYLGIREHYEDFAPLLVVGSSKEAVYRCLTKAEVFDRFVNDTSGLEKHIPPSLILDAFDERRIREFTAALEPPFFLKGDGTEDRDGMASAVMRIGSVDSLLEESTKLLDGMASAVMRIGSVDSLLEASALLLDGYRRILIQGNVTGRKATVNVCYAGGRLLADSMAIAEHESPHTGGLTSFRKTWWNEAMYDDAIRRLAHLEWDGPAMMEYKWDDATGTFHFIEINSRYWAALHLDLFAGRDFPKMQVADFFGQTVEPETGPQRTVLCCQHAPAEAGHVLSLIRDPDVGAMRGVAAVLGYLVSIIDPRVKSDYFFPGDRGLFFRSMWRFVRNLAR